MASLHKDPLGRSPNWYGAFTDHTGRRHFKSTRTTDKTEARKIVNCWQKACELASTTALTPDRARRLIEETVSDLVEASGSGLPAQALEQFFRQAADLAATGKLTRERLRGPVESTIREISASTGQPLPGAKVRDWCNRWLEVKEVEAQASTHTRYELAVRDFVRFMGRDADKDLSTLTTDTFLRYRTDCSKRLSVGSTNTHLKILRACFNEAYRASLIERNHAANVKILESTNEAKRRNLTLDEIREVLKVCGDTPWRGLVLVGLYTGQRLGDCARLTWQQVDLTKKEIWFETQKTGKRLSMHLAKPLADYFTDLPSTDNPADPVFKRFAEMANNVSSLSNAFALEVLIPAKLMVPRAEKHVKTGRGRTGKRQVNPVTFHSLRHSLVTMLKATGASNAMAMAIVGHDSKAISDRYTHMEASDTKPAIEQLPDVTKRGKK